MATKDKCSHLPEYLRRLNGIVWCSYCGTIGKVHDTSAGILWISPALTRDQIRHPGKDYDVPGNILSPYAITPEAWESVLQLSFPDERYPELLLAIRKEGGENCVLIASKAFQIVQDCPDWFEEINAVLESGNLPYALRKYRPYIILGMISH